MHKFILRAVFLCLTTIFLILAGNQALLAQVPPPPPSGGTTNGHGLGGNQSTNTSAPVGSGIEIMLALSIFYSAKKSFNRNK